MRLTKRDLNKNFNYIVRAGYCELQTLCRACGVREIGNASGVYGWNWTAYVFDATNGEQVAVCTGYRDLTGKRIDGVQAFETNAKEIAKNFAFKDWDARAIEESKNATAFADYVVKNWNN